MPLSPSDKLLVHLPGPPPPGWLDAVAARFPQLTVRWELAALDPAASDLVSADTLPREVLDGVTLLCVYPPPSARSIRDLRWVQLISAGSDRWLGHETYRDPGVVFCSGSGCQPGILGYGAIGRQCAHLARALGMDVHAYTRRPRPTPESRRHSGYSVPGTGDPDGLLPARWFHGAAVADFLASGLDVLVLAVPLSDATRGLIGRQQFELLSAGTAKKKTFVCNIARGPIVDTRALMEALEQGLISGAALDVTDPEPLPKDHPLWSAPNVFITPHISWQSTRIVDRVAGLIMENLERLDKGEPLLNRIHK
ncbi:D-2-hydroxyacid dehydrogenase [Tolypocladium ophioglossoides CBS 100239]|uniref:D-2-hydroxyacid dehydrogenase n=1 Tax=Tolypocladium ophioglossoides (strain CBS 100239) TaxID=1163406 RepID=A0A0L0N6M9_TOLOC|nr:D-2-hydroxyacid dehydrogenase [Tolypocladium ophioglossoides CBS 100239]